MGDSVQAGPSGCGSGSGVRCSVNVAINRNVSFKLGAPRVLVCLKGAFLASEASYGDALLVSATRPRFAVYRSQVKRCRTLSNILCVCVCVFF